MVHVQSFNYTSPTYHDNYVKEVSRWKYPVLGRIRKGWFRPYHAQVFVDDFRVPAICHEQFISDIALREDFSFVTESSIRQKFIALIVKLIRFVGPWSNRKVNKMVPMYNNQGWRYNILLGVVDDPKQKSKMDGKYKEVL